MNGTGFVGRISVEIMIVIAFIMLGVSWYMFMTEGGVRLMNRLDDWIEKILKRRENG